MKLVFAFTFACGFVGLARSIVCTKSSEIPCELSQKCIHYTRLCDYYRTRDCPDGSDENDNYCRSSVYTWDRGDGTYRSKENYLEKKGLLIDGTGVLKCKRPGYNYTGTTAYCKDINECENNPCSDYCLNTEGSFQCLCKSGYKIQNIYNCTDIDECENTPCSQICTNYDGGFNCSCQNGYSLSIDASTCEDIDECSNSSMNNCEQLCLNNQGSFSCACHEGYTIATNLTACNDIDECLAIPSLCSQTCVNNVGSYTCQCLNGYTIPDGQSSNCVAHVGNTKIVYVTENNDIFLRIKGTDDAFNLTRRTNVVIKRIFYRTSSEEILWLETYSRGGAISSLPLGQNQNEAKTLINIERGNPGDMAIDFVTMKLYVTDSELSAVIVYEMFEASRTTRLNITADLPSTIILDSKNRFFYYVNLGDRYRGIYKSRMDGHGCSEPFVTSDMGHPSDLFLDDATSLLYWADSILNKIEMISLDGKVRKVLLASSSDPSFKEPISISVYEDNIYWSQKNSFDAYSTNKRNYNEIKVITSDNAKILKVIVTSSYPNELLTRNNSCNLNTCEQMCLLGPNDTSQCVCFTGFIMEDNVTSCTPTSHNNTDDSNGGKRLTVVGVNKVSNMEKEEKIDYESLKQTAQVNLLRALVEKTQDLVERIEKFEINKDSQ